MPDLDAPTREEVHITLEQFDDEAVVTEDGTLHLRSLGWSHRCPPGTPCRQATEALR